MAIDGFFAAAVPFVFYASIFFSVIIFLHRKGVIFADRDSIERRDAINERNKGAMVVGGLVLFIFMGVVYWEVCAEIYDYFRGQSLAYVVSALLLLPFCVVWVVLFACYLYFIHFFGNMRGKK